MSLLYAALVAVGLRLAVLLVNLGSFPRLRPSVPRGKARVSILLPARNEAHNLPQTLPRLLAQPAQEILLLDDRSSDPTAAVACRLAGQDPRFRLLRGQELPEGWKGKSWACHQLAQAASGEVLIFTDADVIWRPGALEAVLAQLERAPGLLSVYPRQQVGSLAERVLVPLIDVVLLTLLPYPLVRTRFPLASAASGQVMAFTRSAYQACGGHRAVREEVLEDVRLAQRVKQARQPLRVALGGDLLEVRMYRSYAEILEGFGKNLGAFHGENPFLLALSALFHLFAYTAPWLLSFVDTRWLLVGGLGMLERLLVNRKTGRELWEAVLVPLAPLMSLPIYLRAWRKTYTWKGRRYTR
ncbi:MULTISPECIES: glycosyltransferase family 2 protein [unclassified Meiothermus]|uniref:glycosyltransferase n=1 Tax=unclassified Meiothermus TaxID=370471 RepID=UPI000D7C6904|nr:MULTISPECIES: glycosyltransferase family 2 protein [unclassified Meiothermus]PZA08824.1 family 2 glycosyl transferase [Meiothermus sp. Pnk-1]RYM36304.1 glycosyltransferase [Meiothermus sp. PNK-Is4]